MIHATTDADSRPCIRSGECSLEINRGLGCSIESKLRVSSRSNSSAPSLGSNPLANRSWTRNRDRLISSDCSTSIARCRGEPRVTQAASLALGGGDAALNGARGKPSLTNASLPTLRYRSSHFASSSSSTARAVSSRFANSARSESQSGAARALTHAESGRFGSRMRARERARGRLGGTAELAQATSLSRRRSRAFLGPSVMPAPLSASEVSEGEHRSSTVMPAAFSFCTVVSTISLLLSSRSPTKSSRLILPEL